MALYEIVGPQTSNDPVVPIASINGVGSGPARKASQGLWNRAYECSKRPLVLRFRHIEQRVAVLPAHAQHGGKALRQRTGGADMNTVDFYLRLSLEDDDLEDESNSITSQREILKDYISSKEEFTGVKIREHIDDGYTGTNFNRPAFQKMIGLVKKNEIRTILVKDLSRFARDYIESGAYIEQIFPFMQVRFISVNDNYDSNNNENGISSLEIPFKNLVYDYYSKDISQKISWLPPNAQGKRPQRHTPQRQAPPRPRARRGPRP